MLHYTVELEEHPRDFQAEVSNPESAIVFKQGGQEFFRLSFKEFDQILEAVARGEKFALAAEQP